MTAPKGSIRALLVQDRSVAQTQLSRVLQHDGDIRVIGPVASAAEAIRAVQQERPDIVIVDLELGDGGSHYVVEQIMSGHPTPILVLSDQVNGRRSASAAEAMVAGALDTLPLPPVWSPATEVEFRHRVRLLRKVTVVRHPRGRRARPMVREPQRGPRQSVVALAASTGGPSALATVLAGLGGLPAPVLVVQHLHPDFTAGLMDLLARSSGLPVQVAEHNELLQRGRVYLAPGHFHLRLAPGLRIELASSPITLHRPSADQLFESMAQHAGAGGVGVLLTGMGEDGAQGMLDMYRAGATTIAQDEESSAVYGMPRAAARLGAVGETLPLTQVAAAVQRAVAGVRT